MRYLLDTSTIIDYNNGDKKVSEHIEQAERIYASALSVFEAMAGAVGDRRLESFLIDLTPFPFTFRDSKRAARVYDTLSKAGSKANVVDVLLYAQALERGLAILTRDSDFGTINETVKGGLEIVKI